MSWMIFWGKLQKPIRKTRRVMAKPEKGMDSWAEQDGMEFMMPFPLHFHWLVDDLHICAGPSVNGQLWCLHRSEEHTSELQSLMRISYAVFCLKNNQTQYCNIQNAR